MADEPSSVTTTNQRIPNSSLPIEYQVRPSNLPSPRESPLTGLAAHPFRPRSVWAEIRKSKLAIFLFFSTSTLIYLDYQRTQRYKVQKALTTVSEVKEATK